MRGGPGVAGMAVQVVYCTEEPSQGGELGLRSSYGLFPRMYPCRAAFTPKGVTF